MYFLEEVCVGEGGGGGGEGGGCGSLALDSSGSFFTFF